MQTPPDNRHDHHFTGTPRRQRDVDTEGKGLGSSTKLPVL